MAHLRKVTTGGFEATSDWTAVEFPEIDSSGQPVVVGSITTFHGGDTAGLRMRNVTAGRLETFIEEETSGDAETSHTTEAVRFIGAPSGPIVGAAGDVIGEAGVVDLDQSDADHWHTITLNHSFHNPVVLTQIMTYNGADACHGRVRNVRAHRFDYKIEEWDVHDGSHIEETIGYIVVESGVHTLEDEDPVSNGLPLEVQTVSVDDEWTRVSFASEFGNNPIVVSRSQTHNGPQEIVTRHRRVNDAGLEIRLQEEEARDGNHVNEAIGVVTTPRRDIEIGFGRLSNVNHNWTGFKYESRISSRPIVLTNIDTFNGPDTAAPQLRNVKPTNAQVRIEEEVSMDSERRHNEETLSVVTLRDGPIEDKNGNQIGFAGTLSFDQPNRSYWHTLRYGGQRLNDSIVFADVQTFNGEDPSHVRLRNVGPESFELQIEEWDYLDGQHFEETIGYLVLESGTHDLADGSTLHVGKIQATHQWFNVNFIPNFRNQQPSLLTQCQTRNGSDPVVTRTLNLDPHGFNLRLQEEQDQDGDHFIEYVGFLGIAQPGRSIPGYETERVLDESVNGFSVGDCAFAFSNDFPAGQYTLPRPISLGPFGEINEIGDTTNGMCGGMVLAVRDYFEQGLSPWSDDLVSRTPPNSPVDNDPPAEDTPLFDFLSERLFDSFMPGDGNPLGAGIYQTLMNTANTEVTGFWSVTQPKKSRTKVMRDEWENEIKPALDNNTLCPIGLIHVDTHGQPFRSGLNQIGENHQVLAYGYTKSGNTIEIYVYDPNAPNDDQRRIQFTKKNDLSEWFEPTYIGSSNPMYAFFAVPYSFKSPPTTF
ncbi:hypothetical protein [Fodinibius salsisoli]|uniref:Peptidase C39-like domain-containing protein n=1 Tax=Fodinibius salsisoli TaxID=2820877 RepID=A0ABT3PN95_9BACT|nr:hypothetical protein [Fodinibius salsisoli]MCW9707278.1 hypothetical protein [Fodinibius salsisoli]